MVGRYCALTDLSQDQQRFKLKHDFATLNVTDPQLSPQKRFYGQGIRLMRLQNDGRIVECFEDSNSDSSSNP